MDPRQRQRLGWIVRFFALLLVLTLLARGTAGAAMASVTVQRPSSGNVTKSVRTTATVSFAGGTPFTVPAGLLVMAVPVQAGQTVKAGDTLAVFDAAEVDRAVNAKRAALQQARTQAAQQTAGDTADPYAAQLAQQQLERAYEETHRIYADGEESVSRAQTKRDEAAAALEKARNATMRTTLKNRPPYKTPPLPWKLRRMPCTAPKKPPKMPTMRHFPPPKVPRITATPHCTRWRKSRKPRKNRTHWTAPLLL